MGSSNQIWQYAEEPAVIAQSVNYSNTYHEKMYCSSTVISTEITGKHFIKFSFETGNGIEGRVFNVYNPNQKDDKRIGQTGSTYVVWEIEKEMGN